MADCNSFNDSCKNTVGPDYDLNPDGTAKNTVPAKQGCIPSLDGKGFQPVESDDLHCRPFQLSEGKSSEYIDRVANEALNIGGAVLNIYKLLGVHEQGKLVDSTGMGNAISNGDFVNFPASNAFDKFITEWRSVQRGNAVTISAYIGYDFGSIKTNDNSRRLYGIDTSIYKHITTLAIKQSSQQSRRVTRVRIERSTDGIKWFGVGVVLLPDDDCLNTIQFKHSVPSRYWRIRALDFNGVDTDDVWGVVAIQMFHDYIATDEYNIQDKVLLENRDRDYSSDVILLKGFYDLTDNLNELTALGLEVPSLILYITISFSGAVAALGRPIVVGDILEVPSEAQYSAEMKRILKWLEVTDVSWSTEGYTPGWQPTMLRIVAQPAFVSQETQDIFGDLGQSEPDAIGSVTGEDGSHQVYQDYFDVSQTIEAEAREAVPERGAEGSGTIRAWEELEIKSAEEQNVQNLQKIGLYPNGLYVEDAMPPNNAPFTEADVFPVSPNHGDYHRLTYTGLSKDIPARLYRYSTTKGRWIYLETDLRAAFNPAKPVLEEFITSPNAVATNKITKPT